MVQNSSLSELNENAASILSSPVTIKHSKKYQDCTDPVLPSQFFFSIGICLVVSLGANLDVGHKDTV